MAKEICPYSFFIEGKLRTLVLCFEIMVKCRHAAMAVSELEA